MRKTGYQATMLLFQHSAVVIGLAILIMMLAVWLLTGAPAHASDDIGG